MSPGILAGCASAFFLAFCLVTSSPSRAQVAVAPATEKLHQADAQANALYHQHEYAKAAAVIEAVRKEDPDVVLVPGWSSTLYNLACDLAQAGQADAAMAALRESIDGGSEISAAHMREDTDLTTLRNRPEFQSLVETLDRGQALWKDSSAITTAYKPVLSEDQKVAGLSKFWSEARFNFAGFDRLPGIDWDALYLRYLQRVRQAKTTADYYRVMMRFSAELHDAHVNVYPPKELFDAFYAKPGLRTALVEGRVVVTQVVDPALQAQGWKVGDVILKVGDLDVRQYAKLNVVPYQSSSTSQDLDVRAFDYFLLSGDVHRPLTLTVDEASGRHAVRTVRRLPSARLTALINTPRAEFRLLPGGIAYLGVNEFEDDSGPKALVAHLAEITASKGLIIDVRQNGGGSSQNGIDILQVLAAAPFKWEMERTLVYNALYRADDIPQHMAAIPQPEFAPDPAHHLSVPVVVLTSAETFSAAEDFVTLFQSMHRGATIGEPTGGSTGQPFSFKLPGGGSARICTKDTRTPDGRVFMGVGLQPDILVRPSVADVRGGRDAALGRAVQYLTAGGAAMSSSSVSR
jgi:carboxyl-terminal processing protease